MSNIIIDGIAPINGPKKGITLVTPIITEIIGANGSPIADIARNVIIPIIAESSILPTTKSISVVSRISTNSRMFC